ncbi:MAG: cell wall-binding repeat-containing protein [Coriobacteriia bacterium]|nr:cell wall-binding repeat-containing protein [Coriobacteriia bacterium]
MRSRISWIVMTLVTCGAVLAAPSIGLANPRTAPWPDGSVRVAVNVERISGPTRYDTAAAIARTAFPGWTDVSHVIIASGLDRSLADPLAAGGLCWAYDAPLLLVDGKSVPGATQAALREIVSMNTTVAVTVVGGASAVSASCMTLLQQIVGVGRVERPFAGADRYATAALIARRVSAIAAADPLLIRPDVALVANGSSGYYDALALSCVSARTGAPVVFVMRDAVPPATAAALREIAPSEIIVAGGDAVVSARTYAALGATDRWFGQNRYATAVTIAEKGIGRGWFGAEGFGVAANTPDALVGATLSARAGMPLLYTVRNQVSPELARFVEGHEDGMVSCVVFGGPAVVLDDVLSQLRGMPARPVMVNPQQDGAATTYMRVSTNVGVNTSQCLLYVGETLVASQTVSSYTTVDFGRILMPETGGKLRVVAANPEDRSSGNEITIRRLSYPASTCIVVDKSDFRLYWIKADELIKSYPVAIGRGSMETPVAMWKILAKYYTNPLGVYGPRKMRLFRKYGSSYVYTAYGIHGTNEPWVIGTKASHGCIRLYNSDVLELFPQVPLGTVVQTRL